MTTVESARRALAAQLKAGGIESPALDARMLAGHVLGLDLTGLIAAAAQPLTSDQATQLDTLARRRLQGEPIARIIAQKEFWGLPLRLSKATLVPRPDTETVVEFALEIARTGSLSQHPLRIADIGTGSGAILLALLSELADASGFGTDISEQALLTARTNARDLGMNARAVFVACDYAAALSGPFDLVVSNPPYIRSAEIAGLAREVREHDPQAGLDGGADGLEAYRAIVPEAARLLAPGGALIMEVGHDQSGDVQGLMRAAGLTVEGAAKADLAGIPRAVAGLKVPL